jgi:type VI secretion system secreted protein Hcp
MRFTSKKIGLSSIFGTILLLMLGFSLMLANSASAALFLLLDDIKGESTDKDHPGWIELNSFSFGVTNLGGGSSGAGAGRVEFSEITITKSTDTASPKLFEAVATGRHFEEATLDDTKTMAGKPVTFLEFKFQNVFVTSFDMIGIANAVPTETVAFNFGKIEMIFNQYDDKGNLIQQIIGGPVNVAPIPGSLLLLGSGLLGLVGWRRTKS